MAANRNMKIGETKKRNTPIATLINLYEDKRSGKVMESRKEIQWRFDALDWEHQQRILTDFLESGKQDRTWACSALLDLWDPCFEPKVQELWEQYHEDVCKWVVIRHMPIDYVLQHSQEFTGRRDYYYICLRLAQDKDYQIETDKLSITDYLGVLFHTGRDFDEIDTQTILFQIVHENCLRRLNEFDFDKRFDYDHPADILCPSDLRDIGRARYYLRTGILTSWEYKSGFWEWNNQVKEAIRTSEEYQQLLAHIERPYFLKDWMHEIMRKYSYIALPDEYKQPSDPSPDDMVRPLEERQYNWYSNIEKDCFEGLEIDELPFPKSISPEEEEPPF
jgi:hypothetical protein